MLPDGWTTWELPGFVGMRVPVLAGEDGFRVGLDWLKEEKIPLVGAVQAYTEPSTGKSWLLFPVEWMKE